jgi:hypothetical protein
MRRGSRSIVRELAKLMAEGLEFEEARSILGRS